MDQVIYTACAYSASIIIILIIHFTCDHMYINSYLIGQKKESPSMLDFHQFNQTQYFFNQINISLNIT